MCEKRWCVVVVALFLGLVTGPGRAELLVYEPFDYPPGGSVDGLNGGSGFAGPWEDDDSSLRIEAGSLFDGMGNKVVGTEDDSVVYRDFPEGTFTGDHDVLWIGMYLQLTDSTSAWIWFGEVDVWFEGDESSVWDGAVGDEGPFYNPPVNEPFWLVAKYDIAKGDVFVFINPTGEPSDGDAVTSFTRAIGFGDWLQINVGPESGGPGIVLDELRMGTTFQDLIGGNQGKADAPHPADGDRDVPRDVVLSWTPSPSAVKHNVFFGTNFDDVNNATVAGAGVEASLGQTGTTFDPAGLLEFGRTYWWRVDEVNAPPGATIYKGDTWSFAVEPYAYQITDIKATASSSEKATNGPEKTIDGSGLTDGGHSTATTDMWLTKFGAPGSAWIMYEFDRAYCLKEVLVWNYNVDFELVLGYGFKEVTVEYSLNGIDWISFSDVLFEQATAQSGYAPSAAIPLNGIYAKFIRFKPKSNYSMMGLKQYGLSEVQFFQVPVVARAPQPADGAAGVSLEPTLSWRPGRQMVSQKVYFGADRQAVADGTASPHNANGNSYQPGSLEYGQVYYWRVDEVNETASPSVRTGDVWSFSTTTFLAVDDFEGYNDAEGQGTRIYETWIDGYSDGSSGSTVGYVDPPFAEREIVHSGYQSMPLDYNNVVSPFFSEAVRTFSPVQDWTVKGVTDLILWVQGRQAPIAPVTETGGKMTVTGEGSDIWDTADEFTFVYKTLSGDGVISARVTDKGTGSNAWAKGGVMIRASLDAGSPHAMMVLTDNDGGDGGNGASFQNRLEPEGGSASTDATTTINVPYYVKVERKGDSITGSVSPDGAKWTQMGATQYIAMTGPAYIGLCVTSHAAGENRTYTFDNIKTTGATGSWATKEIGLARNSPQDLYVVVEDAAGGSAIASQADLVTAGQWTEWRIPLSSLSGVNLAKVKKLSIGVGDRNNPTADGAGRIYIDDIRVGRVLVRPARQIAFEPFDYEDGALDGRDGGSGFAGPWEDEDASHAVSGNRLVGIGGGSIFRDFPAGTFVDDGSAYWWSALIEYDGTSWAWIRPWGESSLTLYIEGETVGLYGGDTGDAEEGFSFPAGQAVWVVVKLVTDPDGDDTVYLFLDPDPGSEPKNADAQGSIVVGPVEDYTMVEVFTEEGGVAGVALDELRWSTGFEFVVGGQ